MRASPSLASFLWLMLQLRGLSALPPVIMVPGFAGSQLFAQANHSLPDSLICRSDEHKIWMDENVFKLEHPERIRCWLKEIRLKIDPKASEVAGTEKSSSGKDIRSFVKEIGDFNGLYDYGAFHGGYGVWAAVVNQLSHLGFHNDSIYGAPYDWRRGPGYWKQHDWVKLKAFVEKVVQKHNKPALLMTVSLGGFYTSAFLQYGAGINAEWKAKYIDAFFSFSGVFTGTPAAVELTLQGSALAKRRLQSMEYDLGVENVGEPVLQGLLQGWGSLAAMMPVARPSATAFRLPSSFGNRTVTNALLGKIAPHISPTFGSYYHLAQNYSVSKHPGVRTYCYFGVGLRSPGEYEYSDTPAKEQKEGPLGGAKGRSDWPSVDHMLGSLIYSILDVEERDPTKAPAGPPEGSKQYDDAWLQAAAELLKHRRPDRQKTVFGDGLVPEESLSACSEWDKQPGPPVYVEKIMHSAHGEELFDAGVMLAVRKQIADLSHVPNPGDQEAHPAQWHRHDKYKDMDFPLLEFQAMDPTMPDEIARLTCRQWVGFYQMNGMSAAAWGCEKDFVIAHPNCDDKLKYALQLDPHFIQRRCPDTCRREFDMPFPLLEFSSGLDAGVENWSCRDLVIGFQTCNPAEVLRTENCSSEANAYWCQELMTFNGNFLRDRCPQTCFQLDYEVAEARNQMFAAIFQWITLFCCCGCCLLMCCLPDKYFFSEENEMEVPLQADMEADPETAMETGEPAAPRPRQAHRSTLGGRLLRFIPFL